MSRTVFTLNDTPEKSNRLEKLSLTKMRSVTSSWRLGRPGCQYSTSEGNVTQLESGQRKKYQISREQTATNSGHQCCNGDLSYCPKKTLTGSCHWTLIRPSKSIHSAECSVPAVGQALSCSCGNHPSSPRKSHVSWEASPQPAASRPCSHLTKQLIFRDKLRSMKLSYLKPFIKRFHFLFGFEDSY